MLPRQNAKRPAKPESTALRKADPAEPVPWQVYLLECIDGSLYTGIAIDVAARFAAHAAGRGARYTRSRPPLRVLATIACADRSAALKIEYAIKQLPAASKRRLAAGSRIVDGIGPAKPWREPHAKRAAVAKVPGKKATRAAVAKQAD